MRHRSGWSGVSGLALGAMVIVWGYAAMGGNLVTLIQPEALAIVVGGTVASLLVSFPSEALKAAGDGLRDLFTRRPEPLETLVPAFMGYARKVRRNGLMAIEPDALAANDSFLARALTLSVSGLSAEVVREALDLEARVCAEREEECAQVLESAAGYAPTLGVVGAVLGLMRVMQSFSPDSVGVGMASAFVATVYGVGAANLVFLPLATRLRGRARLDALKRDLVIDGVLALREGASPTVVEERLAGYLKQGRQSQPLLAGAA